MGDFGPSRQRKKTTWSGERGATIFVAACSCVWVLLGCILPLSPFAPLAVDGQGARAVMRCALFLARDDWDLDKGGGGDVSKPSARMGKEQNVVFLLDRIPRGRSEFPQDSLLSVTWTRTSLVVISVERGRQTMEKRRAVGVGSFSIREVRTAQVRETRAALVESMRAQIERAARIREEGRKKAERAIRYGR